MSPYVKSATGGNALKGLKYVRLYPLTTPVLSSEDKLLPSVDYMKVVPEPATRTTTNLEQTATGLLASLGLSSAFASLGTYLWNPGSPHKTHNSACQIIQFTEGARKTQKKTRISTTILRHSCQKTERNQRQS
jgi:hypothetical protein